MTNIDDTSVDAYLSYKPNKSMQHFSGCIYKKKNNLFFLLLLHNFALICVGLPLNINVFVL